MRITDEQIRELAREASDACDHVQVALCYRALGRAAEEMPYMETELHVLLGHPMISREEAREGCERAMTGGAS